MIKKKEEPNFSDVFNRLAGLNTKPTNNINKNVLLHETFNDGTTYAIVKEGLKYVIKESNDGSMNENSLEYIGGLAQKGKYKYRYNTHNDAEKSFILFKQSINESFIDERRVDDIEPEQAPGEDNSMNFDLDNQTPSQGDDSVVEPPVQQAEPVNQDVPTEEPNNEPVSQNNDDVSDAEIDAEINSDGEDENIDHFVGKLTAALRDTDASELTDTKVKSVLNSIIAALPLNTLSPDDRLKIARRIRKGEDVEEMDIPNEMLSESKKLKEGGNTMENCKYILDSISNGQHKQAKELYGKLRNKEAFFNYLDGLDLPNEMIEGYRKYFESGNVQDINLTSDSDLEENNSEDEKITEPTIEPDTNEPLTVGDSPNENDNDLFRNFILKLAVLKDVGVEKNIAEPDSFFINGYKFIPTSGENGFTTISVIKDDITKMDFILTNDFYDTEFKGLIQTTDEV